MQREIWKLIAADMEKQKQDPLLFPGKASNELLKKFPPTIIWEAEFDMYIHYLSYSNGLQIESSRKSSGVRYNTGK